MEAEFQRLNLTSGNTAATIAPDRGAIVTSFRVGDRELLYLDESTFNDPSKNVRGGIPVLFPSPGKLDGDRWSRDGRSGELKQHGFARNLAWRVGGRDASSVRLHLESSEATRVDYPWDFALTLAYSVTASALNIEFGVKNASDTPMPFAFGLHPYFLVHDKAGARIPTQATRAFDNVTKAIAPFSGFDFTRGEVDVHLIDHDSTRAELALSDGTRIAIDTSPEFARWIVWTIAGKDYVCLEPWTAPGNALNTGDGLIMLEPQQTCALCAKVSWVETSFSG